MPEGYQPLHGTRLARRRSGVRVRKLIISSSPLVSSLKQFSVTAAGEAFETALAKVIVADPFRRVQHPYFGLIDLEEFGIVGAAHTRHHTRFLPSLETPE